MPLNIEKRKLTSILLTSIAVLVFASSANAQTFVRVIGSTGSDKSEINDDLNRFVAYRLTDTPVFRANPWDINFASPKAVVSTIVENIPFAMNPAGGLALCYNDKSSVKTDDLFVKEARVSSCASSSMSVSPTPDLDVAADPKGYIALVRGKDLLADKGFDGGYVVNPYQFIPFEEIDSGVFYLRKSKIPSGLISLQSQTFYRVAQYMGDSMLRKNDAISLCNGITSSDSYVCDSQGNGVFAMKGVALLSFASSCDECSAMERGILVGEGLDYLFSLPASSDLSILASAIYAKNKVDLAVIGFDVSAIERKKLLHLIK
jgi:hypothetical protein